MTTEAVVVGAGPAGLAAGACLRRVNVPFVVLERADRIAAAWHTHYDRLHLHTIRSHSALPYLSFPSTYPRYPSRQQVIDYLEEYARRFNLRPRLGEEALSARHEERQWLTRTNRSLYCSRYLVVATGLNGMPYIPSWPGRDEFQGMLMHSSAYRSGAPYRGMRALVVGMGNSGAEIALDLHENGVETDISVRGGVNVVPRELLGVPVQLLSLWFTRLPPRTSDALMRPLWRLAVGDLERYGLRRPDYGPRAGITFARKIPVIDVGTLQLFKEGRISIRAGIERFASHGVRFSDGTAMPYEVIVLATGYRPGFGSFLTGMDGLLDERGYPRRSGEEIGPPGLYFCSFELSAAGMLRQSGIEAQRIAKDIAAKSGRA